MFNYSIFRDYSGVFNLFSRISDPVVVAVSGYVAYLIKFYPMAYSMPKEYKLLILFVFLCVFVVFPMFGLYASWRGQSLLRQFSTIILSWSTVVLLVIVLLFSFKISSGYSRLWLGYWAIAGLLLLLSVRISVYSFLQYQRARGKNLRRVIVAGAGVLGKRVITTAEKSEWTGYRIAAAFDDLHQLIGTEIGKSCIVKGDLNQVDEFLASNTVDEIWIALPLRAESRVKELLDSISHHAIVIKFIPDVFVFSLLHHSISEIAGLPAVDLTASPIYGSNRIIKEIEDRTLAALILILISPLMLLIAMAVKLTSHGPVFFKQQRVSWNGKPFTMLKFRSMEVSESAGGEWGNADKKKTTRIGEILRKTSLDELPQFINVLTGSMSIVGPRPERSEFVDKFKYEIPGYMQKHMVKAGITGWAQVNGWRGDTCLKTRIEHDLYYIENWSLWFDLKIIFLTIFKGFVNKNAY